MELDADDKLDMSLDEIRSFRNRRKSVPAPAAAATPATPATLGTFEPGKGKNDDARKSRRKQSDRKPIILRHESLYMSGIARNITESDLTIVLRKFGGDGFRKVDKFYEYETGTNAAIVSFHTKEAADKVISELHGRKVNHCTMSVTPRATRG